jgi:2-methylcitrate dehydratase PrpD
MSEVADTSAGNVHTRKIAEFVSRLTYEQIPAEVRARIKLLILDSLGCAIYAADLEWCRILRGTLEGLDASRTTSIWGTDRRLSSVHAALVNGTQVQGFELDDVHRQGVLHVGAVTLPAVVASCSLPRSPATKSGRASACAWAKTTSARAGIPAPPLACSRLRPARRARFRSTWIRPCMRSASPALNRPG